MVKLIFMSVVCLLYDWGNTREGLSRSYNNISIPNLQNVQTQRNDWEVGNMEYLVQM